MGPLNDGGELPDLLKNWESFVAQALPDRGIQAAWAARPIEKEADPELLARLSPKEAQRFAGMNDAASSRKKEWAEARRCEFELQETLSATDIKSSVSHTAGWVVAVGAAGQNLGVGIDIEKKDRKVSAGMRSRLLAKSEMALPLSILEIWTLKEACFKAFPGNAGTILSDYTIQTIESSEQGYQGMMECKILNQTCFIRFRLLRGRFWLMVLAIFF